MATAQLSRKETLSGQWESIFPNEQVTEIQSTLFVKKLLAVAISSITYLRALFPEAAYGDRCLEDVNLKILRDDSAWPDACRVIQWLRGCFDALEKKYLRGVLVGIYDDPEDPDTVIEQYTFKFAYGDGKGIDLYRNGVQIMSAANDKETKKATIRLLRTIVILSQTLLPLQDDVFMTMKLIYYDEVTPEDYDPPGFKKSEGDDFSFKEDPVNIKVGDVTTNFHSFKLRIKTLHHELKSIDSTQVVYQGNKENDPGIIEEAVVPGEDDVIMNDEAEEVISIYPEREKENIEEKALSGNSQENIDAEEILTGKLPLNLPNTAESVSTDEMKTLCPCGIMEDDGLMILCASCNTWQHATCFGIINSSEAPLTHYCIECSKKYIDYTCTDKILSEIDDHNKIADNCLWRRALIACADVSRVLPVTLSKRLGVSVCIGSSLLQRLQDEGFVKAGGKAKRFGKLVQKKEILGRGVDQYFRYITNHVNEDENLAEKASYMEITKDEASNVHECTKRKSREVVSTNNPDLTFDISDSQVSSPKKRRKASISADPMHV